MQNPGPRQTSANGNLLHMPYTTTATYLMRIHSWCPTLSSSNKTMLVPVRWDRCALLHKKKGANGLTHISIRPVSSCSTRAVWNIFDVHKVDQVSMSTTSSGK